MPSVSLRVNVCDVAHGDCIHVSTPCGKNVLIDCGGKGDTSASRWLEALEVESLHNLIISHPHIDHIRDIVNIDKRFCPGTFGRNEAITREKIREENEDVFDDCKDIIEKYLEMNQKYNAPAAPANDTTSPEWDGSAYIYRFCNRSQEMGLNDLSRTSFISCGGHTILHAGDLEEDGWRELLKNKQFCDQLSSTTVLVASHHGRKSGFCSDVFDLLRPVITIVSDGRFQDNSATDRYCKVTKGLEVDGKKRHVLTTRKDKTITVEITDGGALSVECDLVRTDDGQ